MDFNNNEGLWLFAILALFGFGGFGGIGGNRVGEAYSTQADIQRAVDNNATQQNFANIGAEIQRGIYEVNNNTNHVAYDNLGEIRDVQATISSGFANQQNCCCETLRAIDGVNYNTTVQVQKVLDAIVGNRMADMQNQINALQLQNAVAGVVRYPSATTYNAGGSCFASGCGCNI